MDDEGEVWSDVRYHKRLERGKLDVTDLCDIKLLLVEPLLSLLLVDDAMVMERKKISVGIQT